MEMDNKKGKLQKKKKKNGATQLLLKIKIFSIETQAKTQLIGCGPVAQLHTGKITDKKKKIKPHRIMNEKFQNKKRNHK